MSKFDDAERPLTAQQLRGRGIGALPCLACCEAANSVWRNILESIGHTMLNLSKGAEMGAGFFDGPVGYFPAVGLTSPGQLPGVGYDPPIIKPGPLPDVPKVSPPITPLGVGWVWIAIQGIDQVPEFLAQRAIMLGGIGRFLISLSEASAEDEAGNRREINTTEFCEACVRGGVWSQDKRQKRETVTIRRRVDL